MGELLAVGDVVARCVPEGSTVFDGVGVASTDGTGDGEAVASVVGWFPTPVVDAQPVLTTSTANKPVNMARLTTVTTPDEG